MPVIIADVSSVGAASWWIERYALCLLAAASPGSSESVLQCKDKTEPGEDRRAEKEGQSQHLNGGLEMGGQVWTELDGQTGGDECHNLG